VHRPLALGFAALLDADGDTLEALQTIADDSDHVLVSRCDTYVGADTAPEPGAACSRGAG
jgi:hypothetical protein